MGGILTHFLIGFLSAFLIYLYFFIFNKKEFYLKICCVSYGYNSYKLLKKFKPNFLIKNFSNIYKK